MTHPAVVARLARLTMSVALCATGLLCGAARGAESTYDHWFTRATMRVDYFHTGTKGQEILSLDRILREREWPGSRVNLVDTLNLGEYMTEVYDRATNQLIFSRGFSSLFNEWQTTDEAAGGTWRTFSASVRFPYPRREVRVVIERRDKKMIFHELFSTTIDPNASQAVDRSDRPRRFPVHPVMENGAPAEKVDIVILGDGYAKADMPKFRKDAQHFTEVMFSTPPFSVHKKEFNVWMVEVESRESGISMPDIDSWKGNALGCAYSTFGSARYVLSTANRTIRDIAAAAPYDFVCILVNGTRYGGGGIYNLYATTYTDERTKGQEWQMDYVFVHEFGHSFAGLGDEYYSSSTAYNDFYSPGIEPWEPNVTALVDPSKVKWADLVSQGVTVPTPWAKARYDSLEAERAKLDRLAPDYYQKREPLYRAEQQIVKDTALAGKVGAFEGAGYASRGLYRPSLDCRMFSLSLVGFDPVCTRAIERMIDWYAH